MGGACSRQRTNRQRANTPLLPTSHEARALTHSLTVVLLHLYCSVGRDGNVCVLYPYCSRLFIPILIPTPSLLPASDAFFPFFSVLPTLATKKGSPLATALTLTGYFGGLYFLYDLNERNTVRNARLTDCMQAGLVCLNSRGMHLICHCRLMEQYGCHGSLRFSLTLCLLMSPLFLNRCLPSPSSSPSGPSLSFIAFL